MIIATNAAQASISTVGCIAENIVYDSVTEKYWWIFEYRTSTCVIRMASADSLDGPWTVEDNPVISESGHYCKCPFITKFGSYWYIYYGRSDGNDAPCDIWVQKSSSVNTGYSAGGITNPILTRGGAGTWDARRADEPFVFLDGSTYYLFYMGETVTTLLEKTGYATSSDPVSGFTKYGSNPVLPADGWPHGWDSGQDSAADAFVFKDGDTYYIGVSAVADDKEVAAQIGFYTTTDFVTFTHYDWNPVIRPGAYGNWDDFSIIRGAVCLFDSTLHFPYAGYDGTNWRCGKTVLTLSAEESGWLTGWLHRKASTLTRASGATYGYQMELLVGESAGSVDPNVHCEGNCQPDFDDIRLTTADGVTLLDYWIQNITGTTPNQVAKIIVESASINTTGMPIYLYYGKADATAVSNGKNTFLLFDHFDDGSIDTAIWDTGGTPTESGTILTLNAINEYIKSKLTWLQNVALRAKAKLSSAALGSYNGFVAFRSVVTTPLLEWVSNLQTVGKDAGANYVSAAAWTPDQGNSNVERIFDLAWLSDKGKYAYDGGAWVDVTTQVPQSALPVELYNTGDGSLTADWILVRKFLATEPAWGSWGAEEEEEEPPPSGTSFVAWIN